MTPMRVVFEVVPNRDRLQAVLEDRVDCCDRRRNPDPRPDASASGSVLPTTWTVTGILVPGGDEVPELADLRLSRIGLLQGVQRHFLFAVCAPPGRPGSPRQLPGSLRRVERRAT